PHWPLGGRRDSKGGSMKRATLLALAAALLSAAPAPAGAGDRVSVRVPAGAAPRSHRAVSVRYPEMKRVPGTNVFVVSGHCEHDVFRYDGYWYLFSNGYWFRARSYAGTCTGWDVRRAPGAVVNVRAAYGRHPAPPTTSIAGREEPVAAKAHRQGRPAGD